MTKIKFIFVSILIVLVSQTITGQGESFASFMNPVIPGDHPDPSLTRIGADFYSSGSSFSPTPAIYHSTDLVHWEIIAQPVSAAWSIYGESPQDGIWGGQLVNYENKYWYYFGHWGSMYFVTAQHPEGPWSNPVSMQCPDSVPGLGMDNSIFIDNDGSWYLLVKNGQAGNWILQLGSDGQPKGRILNLCWINPAPLFPYSWAEGPVMWKYRGYYYYSFAINAGGGQKVLRSKELSDNQQSWTYLGDLFRESDPKKPQSLFRGPNHCSQAIILDDSTSWVIYQSYLTANAEWEGIGRQGLLSRVRYDTNGKPTADYPINEQNASPALSSSGIPWMVPHSDFFAEAKLNPEWSLLGYSKTLPYSLVARPGWLRLFPGNHQNALIKTDAEHNYSLITRLDFNPKAISDEAGLRIITGLQTLSANLFSSVNNAGEKVITFRFGSISYSITNSIGNDVWLRLVRENHSLTGYYSANGLDWTLVGKPIDVKSMDIQQSDYNAWTGNRQGLYVKGTTADFDLYIYRDAYTSIIAEYPANQHGTSRYAAVSGTGYLDQIHNNDWALYAGVEFRNPDSTLTPLIFEANASSLESTGLIEVWLDSIQTGQKISECKITSTGGTYANFTSPVEAVSGIHDLYLKFRGEGAAKLFLLKSFRFLSSKLPATDNRIQIVNNNKPIIFPNPATEIFYISKSLNIVRKVEILTSSGQLVQSEQSMNQQMDKYYINIKLPNGIYLVKIIGDNFVANEKLVIEK